MGFELAFELTSRINVWHLLGRNELQWLAEAMVGMHFASAVKSVVLRGHDGRAFAVAISPDNRWVVTGSNDKTARLRLLQMRHLICLARITVGRNFPLTHRTANQFPRSAITFIGFLQTMQALPERGNGFFVARILSAIGASACCAGQLVLRL